MVNRRDFCRFVSVALVTSTGAIVGCRAAPSPDVPLDTSLARYSRDAAEAYAEGDEQAALSKYRKALARAWARDDAGESGSVAYNLAAIAFGRGQNGKAKDWLIEARYQLGRGCRSTGNVWLLESRIAQDEARWNDAARYLDLAQCAEPPCPDDPETCSCLGLLEKRVDAPEDCEQAFSAQVHLARARLAAEMYDIPLALGHLASARQVTGQMPSDDLQAEIQNVAALIHLAKGETWQAAGHFDREVEWLRRAGNYREIPSALELAAGAYQQTGRPAEAADRLARVARIWLGRGDGKRAWQFVQRAGGLIEFDPSPSGRIRLSVVAGEIERTLIAGGGSLPVDPDGPQMLSDDPARKPTIELTEAISPL